LSAAVGAKLQTGVVSIRRFIALAFLRPPRHFHLEALRLSAENLKKLEIFVNFVLFG
jgi:hypothetical protein